MVTIAGTGLAGSTIAGAACSSPSVTATQITCTTPAGTAGDQALTVTKPRKGKLTTGKRSTLVASASTAPGCTLTVSAPTFVKRTATGGLTVKPKRAGKLTVTLSATGPNHTPAPIWTRTWAIRKAN